MATLYRGGTGGSRRGLPSIHVGGDDHASDSENADGSSGGGGGSGGHKGVVGTNFSLATINSQAELDALQRELGETRMFVSSLVRREDISSVRLPGSGTAGGGPSQPRGSARRTTSGGSLSGVGSVPSSSAFSSQASNNSAFSGASSSSSSSSSSTSSPSNTSAAHGGSQSLHARRFGSRGGPLTQTLLPTGGGAGGHHFHNQHHNHISGSASPRALRAWSVKVSGAPNGGEQHGPSSSSGNSSPGGAAGSNLGGGGYPPLAPAPGGPRSPRAGGHMSPLPPSSPESGRRRDHGFADSPTRTSSNNKPRSPVPALPSRPVTPGSTLTQVPDPAGLRGGSGHANGHHHHHQQPEEEHRAKIALLGERLSSLPSTASTFGRMSASESLSGFAHGGDDDGDAPGAWDDIVDPDGTAASQGPIPPTVVASRLREQMQRKDREIQRLRQENASLRRSAGRGTVSIALAPEQQQQQQQHQHQQSFPVSAAHHALASSGEGPAAAASRSRSSSAPILSEGPRTVMGTSTVVMELPPGVRAGDLHDASIVRTVLKHNRLPVDDPLAHPPKGSGADASGAGGGGGQGDDESDNGMGDDDEFMDYLASVTGGNPDGILPRRGGKGGKNGGGKNAGKRTPRERWYYAIKAVRSTLRMRQEVTRRRRGTVADRMASPHVQALLEKVDLYSFDIFDLNEVSQENPLVYVGIKIFQRHNLCASFRIDEAKLRLFLERIQTGYIATNTYHNSIHAADVTQTFHSFLAAGGLAQHLTNRDILAGIVSAAVHDFEHPGVNNNFLVATRHEKAIRYNDKSVLENHHVAATYAILQDDRYNIFRNLEPDEYKEVRNTIITMVLATDNSQHFHHLKEFTTLLKANEGDLNYQDPNHRRMLLRVALHAADISNPAKPASISHEWTNRVMEEFFAQGDRERELKLPVSPFMDRKTTSIGKCQRGFIEFLVAPLFKALCPLLVNGDVLIHTIETNRAYWASQEEAELSRKK